MYNVERSSEAPVCDPYRDLSKEGVMSSSMVGETCCLSINPGEARRLFGRNQSCRLSSDVIVPEKLAGYPWT